MENIMMNLPPEIWRIIISHMKPRDRMNLVMASSRLAACVVPTEKNRRYWRVDCCKLARHTLTLDETPVYSCKTSLKKFIEAYKHELAPVSAQRVIFDFCIHQDKPVNRTNYAASKIDNECSPEQVEELFRLLNARRITISIKLADHKRHFSICNEPLVRYMLFYSIRFLPNAAVNFRMKLPPGKYIRPRYVGSYFMTIRDPRDPAMPLAAVETNLQLAYYATTVPQLRRDASWDFAKICFVSPNVGDDNIDRGFFYKLRCLTCNIDFDCHNPDNLLRENPTCVWPTAKYWNNPYMQPIVEFPGSTFFFNYVPEAEARHCTRISAYAENFEWIRSFLEHREAFEHVKVLHFYHADTRGERFRNVPHIPSTLTTIVSACLGLLPGLETMTFMFHPEKLSDMARPELLTEGQSLWTYYCQDSLQILYYIQINITAIRNTLEVPGCPADGSRQFWNFIESF